jgi:hypothetical protein
MSPSLINGANSSLGTFPLTYTSKGKANRRQCKKGANTRQGNSQQQQQQHQHNKTQPQGQRTQLLARMQRSNGTQKFTFAKLSNGTQK